jgi:large subunit ribosomal protein L3
MCHFKWVIGLAFSLFMDIYLHFYKYRVISSDKPNNWLYAYEAPYLGPSTRNMKFILGKKQNMTQVFDDKGRVRAGTVVSVTPMVVTQVKTNEKDGYSALQFGAFPKRKIQNKALMGHLKDMGNFSLLKEYSLLDSTLNVGDSVSVDVFSVGDKVEISGLSKSKGFQGVIKRHGFHGGPRTHGQKHSEKEPGSISGGLRTRVPKGMRMAGRMGGDRITVKNLSVLAVLPEKNEIIIKGAVPGRRGSILEIKG